MNDDVKEQNSTPPEELKRQIMSYSEPKNEREWWAMHRIEQLEAALRKAEQGLSVALMWSDDDGTWVAHGIVVKARDIARAALEGEDGETV